MKASGIFLLSLLSFVVASHHHGSVSYVESVKAIHEAKTQLQHYILTMKYGIPDITSPRRHYAVLMTHVARVAYMVHHHIGDLYSDIYKKSLPDSIVIGLTDVKNIVSTTKKALGILDKNTNKILSLINTLCADLTPEAVCNQIVEQAVKGDSERYHDEAKMLLKAGRFAKNLLNANFGRVAKSYEEVPYLINHMNDLSEMIFSFAKLIHKYYWGKK